MQSSLENAHKSCPSIFPGQPCASGEREGPAKREGEGQAYAEAASQPGKDPVPASELEAAGAGPGGIKAVDAVGCGLQLAADAGDGFGRIDDRDPGMAAEGEEIGIAG